MKERLPFDEHVVAARALFRKIGFDIAAMQFPRCDEALIALKRFNGVPDTFKAPFVWNFHPNAWCRGNWRTTYQRKAICANQVHTT